MEEFCFKETLVSIQSRVEQKKFTYEVQIRTRKVQMKYKVFHLEEDWMYFLIMLNEYVILNEIFTNLKEGKKKKINK